MIGRWRFFLAAMGALGLASAGAPGQTLPAVAMTQAAADVKAALGKSVGRLLKLDTATMDDLHQAMVLTALLEATPSLDSPVLLPSSANMERRIANVVDIEPKTMQTAAWQIRALSLLPDRAETRTALDRAAGILIRELKADSQAKPPKVGAAGLSPQDLHLAVFALQTSVDEAIPVPNELWIQLEKVVAPPDAAARGSAAGVSAIPPVSAMSLSEASALGVTELRIFDALHSDTRKPGEEDQTIAPTLQRAAELYKASPVAGDAAMSLSDLLLHTGQRRLGGTLWLPALDHELLAAQHSDGTWTGSTGQSQTPQHTIEATAQDVLVLARANAPVAICKFSYDGQWNGRPRDAANITAWLSDAFGRPLRWQVVSTSDDQAAWSEAPVLFMTGNKDPKFAPDTLARLRDYAWRGGLILSSPDNKADDKANDFTSSIATHWAPEAFGKEFAPRDLPEDHALFTLWGKLSAPPRLESIGNGVRELWVQSQSDLGATWHGRRLNTHDQWTFAANLFLYSTGREYVRPQAVHAASAEQTTMTLPLARVSFTGNWNPEPLLAGAMAEQARAYHVDLRITDVPAANLDPKATPLAYLTGAGVIHLSDQEMTALRQYMDGGGLLLVDCDGGDVAFGDSFAALVEKLTPGLKLQPLPLNHPIYNGAIEGSLKTVAAQYRKSATAPQGSSAAPRLQACLDQFGRPRLIFSPDDMTSGIVGITTWGILGYDVSSARTLLRNVVLYAAHGGRTPETIPTPFREAANPAGSSIPGHQ